MRPAPGIAFRGSRSGARRAAPRATLPRPARGERACSDTFVARARLRDGPLNHLLAPLREQTDGN